MWNDCRVDLWTHTTFKRDLGQVSVYCLAPPPGTTSRTGARDDASASDHCIDVNSLTRSIWMSGSFLLAHAHSLEAKATWLYGEGQKDFCTCPFVRRSLLIKTWPLLALVPSLKSVSVLSSGNWTKNPVCCWEAALSLLIIHFCVLSLLLFMTQVQQ